MMNLRVTKNGRRLRLTPEVAGQIRSDLASCEWGKRGERYAYWADRLGVSYSTIERTVQLWAGRVPDGQIGVTYGAEFVRAVSI
jgi:hypothetical protein